MTIEELTKQLSVLSEAFGDQCDLGVLEGDDARTITGIVVRIDTDGGADINFEIESD